MSSAEFVVAHRHSALKFSLFAADSRFTVEGRNCRFSSPAYSSILIEMLNKHPRHLSPEEILNILRRHNLGNTNDEPALVVRRIVSLIRKELRTNGVHDDPIETKRGFGYKFSEKWTSINDNIKTSRDSTDFLLSIAEECKSLCKNINIVTTNSGIMYANVDVEKATELFAKAYGFLRPYILLNTVHGRNPETIRLKKEAWEFLSYVAFWRVGEKITERDWKDDYFSEIDASLKVIRMLVNQIEFK